VQSSSQTVTTNKTNTQLFTKAKQSKAKQSKAKQSKVKLGEGCSLYASMLLLQAGCTSCRPTNSVKALKGKIKFCRGAHPKLARGLSTLSLTTNSSWLPWGRVAMTLIKN